MEEEFAGVFKPIPAHISFSSATELLTEEERNKWFKNGWEYYTESPYIAEDRVIGCLFLFRRKINNTHSIE